MDELLKKGFAAWETATNRYVEQVLQSPVVLKPIGLALSSSMGLWALKGRATAALWGTLGLATKKDQERTLHALNQLQSQLLDLEERLDKRGEARR